MTLSMTLTLTNDSLLLLGLVIVTLTFCLYGYCKGGGDAIEVQQQQYDGTADGAPNGVANGATDGATDEDKQDTVEDEARNRDQGDVLEETIPPTPSSGGGGTGAAKLGGQGAAADAQPHPPAAPVANPLSQQQEQQRDETTMTTMAVGAVAPTGGAIMVQQQYRVLYNPIRRHMWTIFRNPNAGMISLYQLIRNLYNMAMWVSNPLQLQVQQASAGNNEDEEDEDEEYNAGYFERVSSKLTYDKVCTCYRACADTFPPINDALHELFHLLHRKNLNVHELKYKFYVSIAEALEECPKYIKWMVPYIRRSVPAEVVEEEEKDDDKDFLTNYDKNDPVEEVPGDEEEQLIRMERDVHNLTLPVSVVKASTSPNTSDVTGDNVLTAFVRGAHNSIPPITLIPKQEDGNIFWYTIRQVGFELIYTTKQFRELTLTDILRKDVRMTVITLTIGDEVDGANPTTIPPSPLSRAPLLADGNDDDTDDDGGGVGGRDDSDNGSLEDHRNRDPFSSRHDNDNEDAASTGGLPPAASPPSLTATAVTPPSCATTASTFTSNKGDDQISSRTRTATKKKTMTKKKAAPKKMAPQKLFATKKKKITKKKVAPKKKITPQKSFKDYNSQLTVDSSDDDEGSLWNKNYNRLLKRFKSRGHSVVTELDPDQHLYQWYGQQKEKRTEGKLPSWKVKKLSPLKFCWNEVDKEWDATCKELMLHHKQNPNSGPPAHLIPWALDLREANQDRSITCEHEDALLEIDPLFFTRSISMPPPTSTTSNTDTDFAAAAPTATATASNQYGGLTMPFRDSNSSNESKEEEEEEEVADDDGSFKLGDNSLSEEEEEEEDDLPAGVASISSASEDRRVTFSNPDEEGKKDPVSVPPKSVIKKKRRRGYTKDVTVRPEDYYDAIITFRSPTFEHMTHKAFCKSPLSGPNITGSKSHTNSFGRFLGLQKKGKFKNPRGADKVVHVPQTTNDVFDFPGEDNSNTTTARADRRSRRNKRKRDTGSKDKTATTKKKKK